MSVSKVVIYFIIGLVVGLSIGMAGRYAIHVPSKTVSTIASFSTTTVTTTLPTTFTSSAPFAIGAAGTLKFAFTTILNEVYTKLYPQITVAPPLFKGSGEIAHDELAAKEFSIVASADTITIPSVLFPANFTDYEIAFGLTQMVIIVDMNTSAGREVYSLWQQAQKYQMYSAQWNQTWKEIFTIIALNKSTVVGVSNPFTDPSGYQAMFVLKLAGLVFFHNESYLFNAVYNNPSKYIMRNTEIDLFTLMQSGQIQFILSAYLSNGMIQTELYKGTAYITLPPQINLGNLSYVPLYHEVNVTWTENGVTKTFIGNPVVYTITIPKYAPNYQAAVLFLLTLFSPQGQKILEEYGITPIFPGIVYGNINSVPLQLLPFVEPVPPQYASIFPST